MTSFDLPARASCLDLPKVELHVHLVGAIGPALGRALAARNGVVVPARYLAGAEEPAGFRDFSEFIATYLALSRCLKSVRDLRETVVSLSGALAQEGVRYAEVTVTPCTHLRDGVTAEVLCEGLAQGRAESLLVHGVAIRFVLDVVRSMPADADPTLQFARRLERVDPGSVVGLGLGGPETLGDLRVFGPVFQEAKRLGFASLPHAGEQAGARNVWDAIEHLAADRIGHGFRAADDPALLAHLAERGTTLEVCPTSNVRLGYVSQLAAHPLPAILAAGVPVTLATDDPGIMGHSLRRELSACAAAYAWSEAALVSVLAAGVRASYAPSDQKREWLAAYDDFLAGVPAPTHR